MKCQGFFRSVLCQKYIGKLVSLFGNALSCLYSCEIKCNQIKKAKRKKNQQDTYCSKLMTEGNRSILNVFPLLFLEALKSFESFVMGKIPIAEILMCWLQNFLICLS